MSEAYSDIHPVDEPKRPKKPRKGRGAIGAAWWGAWGGVLLFVAMFVLSCAAFLKSADLSVFGVSDDQYVELAKNYKTPGLMVWLKLLPAYGVIGAALGAFFGLVAGGFLPREKRIGRLSCLFSGAVGALMVHVAMILYAIGTVPGMYAPYFYDAGGILSAVQQVATYLLVPPVMKTFLALLFLAGLVRIFRRIHAVAGPILLAALLIAAGAGYYFYFLRQPAPLLKTDSARPNILILASDSIRPDRLGCYGHFRATSPNIDKVAADGFFFGDAYAALARTFPSWASILTGQDPQTHGIRHMFPDSAATELKDSIAFRLKEKGYRTAVFSDYAGDIFPRMKAGFDLVRAPNFVASTYPLYNVFRAHWNLLPYLDNEPARNLYPILDWFEDNADPKVITNRLIRYIDQEPGAPFFAVAFYSPTHFPFSVRYPDYKKFTHSEYRGKYKYRKPVELGLSEISTDDVEQIRGLFDGAIFSFDREVGKVMKALEKRGGLENTIVIITSDHGEALYEQADDIGHGDHFRGNFTLQVPLVVHWPKGLGPIGAQGKAGRIGGLVSHEDLVPTLDAALGIQAPGKVDGVDLTPLITGTSLSVRRAIFAETGIWFMHLNQEYFKDRRIDYPQIMQLLDKGEVARDPINGAVMIDGKYDDIINIAKHRMIFDGQRKLVYMPTSRGIRYECYDRHEDPDEQVDLYLEVPESCQDLKEELLEWMGLAPGVELVNGFALPAE